MKYTKDKFANLIILIIFIAGIYFRATWYGDLRLSTANAETTSYMTSARASIFSWKIFAGQRLFTTNLLYKFATDLEQCPLLSYGKPGLGLEVERLVQPCFDKIILIQNVLAIFGWCFLGWMLARQLRNPLVKISAATLVMLFGFTPQIAEWDSVLSPESLSLSMFAIILGLAFELAFRTAKAETPFASKTDRFLLALLGILYFLWIFIRDVHLYSIPVTVALLALFLFKKQFRQTKTLLITLAALLVIFVVGYASARDSLRATRFPLMNSLDIYIWPYPSRVEFFRNYGMPDKEAPSYFDSPKYQAWADENAAKAYAMFLISHPGFVVTTLWGNMDLLTEDYAQPYFTTDEVKNREIMFVVGEMVNPDSGVVYLFTILILVIYVAQAAPKSNPTLTTWAWLAVWVYGIAAATLFISYFGDTAGLRRHIMPSVEMIRLHLLIFIMPFLDLSLNKES